MRLTDNDLNRVREFARQQFTQGTLDADYQNSRLPRRNLYHALFPVPGRAAFYADCAEERNPVAAGAKQIGAITALSRGERGKGEVRFAVFSCELALLPFRAGGRYPLRHFVFNGGQ